ncbi:hypothetical protein FACS1894205_2520 [Alphaproteobacteria bacterium]|nr:hypothetical protein FACS1894205_2520 [Alphaproteobacteria bacterium]
MEFKDLINSPGLWIASSFMIIAIVVQSIVFLRASMREADRIGLERKRYIGGIRSAIITAIGPSLSTVIVLLSLLTVMGGPTTWMRLNDIGAARTELAMISMSAKLVGAQVGTESFGEQAFTYAIWGMALNNMGWILVTLLCVHNMSKIVDKLYAKYNPAWIRLLMAGTIIGLFSYLLSGQITAPMLRGQYGNLCAGFVSAITMLIISRVFGGNQRLQELALGIAMVTGMFTAQGIFG